jgi:hypothetical protein
MPRTKLPFVAWFGAFACTAVLGSLAFVAITERSLSTGGRSGIHHYEGAAAVHMGFFFYAVVLVVWGAIARVSRFHRLIWLALALVWLGSVGAYVALHGKA